MTETTEKRAGCNPERVQRLALLRTVREGIGTPRPRGRCRTAADAAARRMARGAGAGGSRRASGAACGAAAAGTRTAGKPKRKEACRMQAVRRIVFDVTPDGVTPAAPQPAGVHGEHNAAAVVFRLGASLLEAGLPLPHRVCGRRRAV